MRATFKMQILAKSMQWIKNEIRGWFLLLGIIVLIPFAVLFLLTENSYWLEISVLTMSTLIVEEKLQLTVLGVLLHGLAIMFLFYLLFFTQELPILFILSSTLSATAIIWIACKGDKLRTLGNWTFIPAIILSIELASEMKPVFSLYSLTHLIPYLIVALIPTLAITLFNQIKFYQEGRGYQFLQLSYLSDFGAKKNNAESMIAMALGVGVSAFLVQYIPMQNGQWMIWGVASVITGEIETTPRKFHQRLTGVLIGVPVGILLGQFVVPSTPFNLTLTTVALFLTLVAFRRYIIAYTLRCVFVATVVMLITHSRAIAFERLSHVIIGGLIGLVCVMLCHFLNRTYAKFRSLR
ncbi:TPA: FUSC family protein [Legionella feeleii]